MSLGRGIAGVLMVIAIAYLFSYDRKRIDWEAGGWRSVDTVGIGFVHSLYSYRGEFV